MVSIRLEPLLAELEPDIVGGKIEFSGVASDIVTFSTCVSMLSKDVVVPSADTSCGTTVVTVDEKVLIPEVSRIVVCCEGVAADNGMAGIVLVCVVPALVPVFEVGWSVLPASVDVAETEGSAGDEAVIVKVTDEVSICVVVHGCQFGLLESVTGTTAV